MLKKHVKFLIILQKEMNFIFMTLKQNRRTAKPKRRPVRERREDMLIISSASHADIYIWAVSMAFMVGVLAVFIVCAILIGGN